MVNNRYPGKIGVDGITGNGGASRMVKEKNDDRLFVKSALCKKMRFFICFKSHLLILKGLNMRFIKNNILIVISLIGLFFVLPAMAGCSGTVTPSTITPVNITATSIPTVSTTATLVPVNTPAPAAPKWVEKIELNVSAAASLTDALQAVNDWYMQDNKNVKIVANFASSGILQKQIEQGAPADVFISAAAKQMDALHTGGLILEDTRKDLLTNKIVLVVPSKSTLNISSFTDLLNDDVKQIAIGDPEFVPSGIYGKRAFEVLGIYEQIKDKLILQIDTPHVLGYIESGNVDAGIVYATDAALTDKVRIVAEAPDEVNRQIIYPVAVIKASKNADAAKAYIAYLAGNEAKMIFKKFGFVVVNK
jgi:molybdate transport system substrate-binding protein